MRWPKLSSFAFLFSVIRTRYFLSEPQRRSRDHFAAKDVGRDKKARPVVALAAVEDLAYFGIFAALIKQLRQLEPLRVDIFVPRSLNHSSSLSLRTLFWAVAISNRLTDRVWKRLYFSFCDRVAYRSGSWMAPWTELRIFRTARRLLPGLDSTDALAGMTVRGIRIGDLVIDSYLRFKPSPMVRLDDPYLTVVIRQALRDLEKAFRYFGTVKPDLYFTNYTTYVQLGIAARVAVACGVRVLSFGNFNEFSKVITTADPCHTRYSAGYAADFARLPDRDAKIAAADNLLSARVRGQIDAAAAYMKASAWQDNSESVPDVRGSVVIFLHDFYDSVHIYPWLLFHDFWNWICFTIDVLERHGIPFFIKPHPNQVGDSDEAFAALCRKYPKLQILPPGTNNRQLTEGGIAGAITMYGSISSEMAYLGIPSVSCGDNPHSSFSFCRAARSLAEYEASLRDFDIPQTSREDMRDQACAFFYMHNLDATAEALDLRDRSVKLRISIWNNPYRPAEDVLADFREFEAGESLKGFCERLIQDVAAGQRGAWRA